MTKVFSHSGDIGDIIYSLPTIKACGGGKLTLFDYPGRTAHGMTEAKMLRMKPLLELQPYIHGVDFSEGMPDSSLNGFRHHGGHGNLADMHLATHGLDWTHRQEKWIQVDKAVHAYDVIIHRSDRYHNNAGGFPWRRILEFYAGRVGFCGFPEEHWNFSNEFGDVPFVRAGDLLELARVIAGSKLFCGNQSSPCAIAHGMKHPTIMEVCPGGSQHHCIFQRMNCILGWDLKLELPEI